MISIVGTNKRIHGLQYTTGTGIAPKRIPYTHSHLVLFSSFVSHHTAKEDPGTTGNFEVTIVETGQLLHSKRRAGQGRCQTESERRAVLQQILERLEEVTD